MTVVIERHAVADTLADEVRDGLTRSLKELPPKLFYDERGSRLKSPTTPCTRSPGYSSTSSSAQARTTDSSTSNGT